MNADRVAEIRARLREAKPGPWQVRPGSSSVYTTGREDYPHAFAEDKGDAELIANAPADIAWLLEEVERLNKRVRMYEVVKS